MEKELVLRVTRDDCDWEYFRGSGKGGQKRNKTSNAVRCTHRASGAVGRAEDGRSQLQNKQAAFRRMAESEKFKNWLRLAVAQKIGNQQSAEEWAQQEIEDENKVKVEYRKDGKWQEAKSIEEDA